MVSRLSDNLAGRVFKTMNVTGKQIIQAFGIFHLFGSVIALLASVTLLFPGTPIDNMWVVNPSAHKELLPFAKMAAMGFLLLSPLLALAGYGLFHFKRWGWSIAILLIGTNVIGEVSNLWRGELLKGIIGVGIALTILLYLLSSPVKKSLFSKTEMGLARRFERTSHLSTYSGSFS
jgi:hypothetical protein